MKCVVRSLQCSVGSMQCAVYTAIFVQCVLFSEHCALLSVQCVGDTSLCAVREDIHVKVDMRIFLSGLEGKKLKETEKIRQAGILYLVVKL